MIRLLWWRRPAPEQVDPVDPADEAVVAGRAQVLADYRRVADERARLERELERLKDLRDAMPDGTYGAWRKETDHAARSVLDQRRAKQLLIERGVEVPMSPVKVVQVFEVGER